MVNKITVFIATAVAGSVPLIPFSRCKDTTSGEGGVRE
jgi:hypothetical protein